MQEGKYKYIPYHQLFRRTEFIDIPHYGRFEGYANRDSLKYREMYGLEDVQTMFRGTLRRPGFCRAWDVFVQLGMTLHNTVAYLLGIDVAIDDCLLVTCLTTSLLGPSQIGLGPGRDCRS